MRLFRAALLDGDLHPQQGLLIMAEGRRRALQPQTEPFQYAIL